MLFLSILIACLLLIATGWIEYQIHQQASLERLNNRKRVQSWWVILMVCLPVFYVGHYLLLFFILGLSIWATYEFANLLKYRLSLIHILPITPVMAIYTLPYSSNLYFTVLLCLPIALMLLSLMVPTQRSILIHTLLVTSALSTLIIIQTLSHSASYHTGLLLLFLVAITALNDILQYISGHLFGKHPFAPKLSPSKTYEGAIGGLLLTSIIGALTLPVIFNINWQTAFFIASLLSICGMLGDLYISYFKRRAKVKNTGTSIPGHGGLLDRIDSLLLTAPVFGLSLIFIK